jgi:hypothetical protein
MLQIADIFSVATNRGGKGQGETQRRRIRMILSGSI